MSSYKLIVIKSTVPVGTFQQVKNLVQTILKKRNVDVEFDIASNPEFLREGSAINDCMKADRIIIGVESDKARDLLKKIYEPFLRNGNPFIVMDPSSSEMTKYAANAMLAAKISLMNELAVICEKVGADIEMIRHGIGTDHRIGPHSIYAGLGYGGSCFPKDVTALIKTGSNLDENLHILNAVKKTNDLQRQKFIQKIFTKFKYVSGKTFAVWGVSFKPETDDIREAPAIDIIDALLKAGAKVRCFDPVAEKNTLKHFKNKDSLTFHADQYQTLENAEALIIPTEWKSFRHPDFAKMKSNMKSHNVFDGRNIYSVAEMKTLGFEYHSIGRTH